MSENYEYINNNTEIKYTNTEYPDFYITVEADGADDADNKLKVKHIFHERVAYYNPMQETMNICDKVWMEGQHVRSDYYSTVEESKELVNTLNTKFPGTNYQKYGKNLISKFNPKRKPYNNTSISWYSMEEIPDNLKEKYKCNYSKYMTWYGLKFDLTTNKVLLKAVVDIEDIIAEHYLKNIYIKLPRLDTRAVDGAFLAFLHYEDGRVSSYGDLYLRCSDIFIKEFCDLNNLKFPYDYSNKNIRDNVWIWGIVFDRITGEFKHVKAYERIYR